MSYTIEELQPKAQTVIEALATGDPRGTALVLVLALKLELPPQRVVEGVQMLARGEMPS